jgi:hypothetical protein
MGLSPRQDAQKAASHSGSDVRSGPRARRRTRARVDSQGPRHARDGPRLRGPNRVSRLPLLALFRARERARVPRRLSEARRPPGVQPRDRAAEGRPRPSARRERAFSAPPARSQDGSSREGRLQRWAIRGRCSGRGTRPLARSQRTVRRAARGHEHLAERAVERPRREPRHSGGGGASSASCSRTSRISSRSCGSAASLRTSARIDERTRRRAAASRRAVRTASESVSPSARTTSRAAAEASSSRT